MGKMRTIDHSTMIQYQRTAVNQCSAQSITTYITVIALPIGDSVFDFASVRDGILDLIVNKKETVAVRRHSIVTAIASL